MTEYQITQSLDTNLCMSSPYGPYTKNHSFQDFQSLLFYYNVNRRGRGFRRDRLKQQVPQWLLSLSHWPAWQVLPSSLSLIRATFFMVSLGAIKQKESILHPPPGPRSLRSLASALALTGRWPWASQGPAAFPGVTDPWDVKGGGSGSWGDPLLQGCGESWLVSSSFKQGICNFTLAIDCKVKVKPLWVCFEPPSLPRSGRYLFDYFIIIIFTSKRYLFFSLHSWLNLDFTV